MRTAVHNLAMPHARSDVGIVTFSAGVATCVPACSDFGWQVMMEEVDAALYLAKSHGRDRIEIWRPPGRPIGPVVAVVGLTEPVA